MIRDRLVDMADSRTWRHVLFWICWVVGFTFIKSFGESGDVYFGWFSYYVLTLPIFVTHTYVLAYGLIPKFFTHKYYPIFILLFMGLFYGFSVLELLLSNEYIFKWYPTGSSVAKDYLAPGNVIRSGLGNLYIVMVFLASRTVRNWYLADVIQKELQQSELQLQMEDAMTRVQPMMLLFAIDQIDWMVDHSSSDVTNAIALTSELLNEVMIYHGEEQQLFSKEIELVKKLVSLVAILRESKPDVEFFISGDPGQINLPPMILFSLVDLIFRRFSQERSIPELNIEASGYSNMISIQVLNSGSKKLDDHMEECLKTIAQLESCYQGKVTITLEPHNYGCSVIIRNGDPSGVNTFHKLPDAVGMA
ncbi:MAG: hypothetical protein ABFS38_21705 [Bacteroidota bacterium]